MRALSGGAFPQHGRDTGFSTATVGAVGSGAVDTASAVGTTGVSAASAACLSAASAADIGTDAVTTSVGIETAAAGCATLSVCVGAAKGDGP